VEEEMDKKMENGIRKEEQARSSLNLMLALPMMHWMFL
jgi:hypothetical protein